MEDGTVVLTEGEAFVVPKGVRHNPIAEQECHVMLVERKATLHRGPRGRTRRAAWPSNFVRCEVLARPLL